MGVFEKIVLVTRKTRLEESLKRFNTLQQTRFYVESRGQSFADYELEYENYQRAREAVMRAIPSEFRVQEIDRSFLPNFLFAPDDLVLILGQDGLVVNTAKYLDGQLVLAVNPDPERFDGVLLPYQIASVYDVLKSLAYLADSDATVLTNNLTELKPTNHQSGVEHIMKAMLQSAGLNMAAISMARADLNDGQSLLAFNDFYIGARSHTSARYSLQHGLQRERHSSSGIIVSTPAGSTGWLSSLLNMADGIQKFVGQAKTEKNKIKHMKNDAVADIADDSSSTGLNSAMAEAGSRASFFNDSMDWSARRLIFMVREPFRSQWSQADLVAGEIHEGQELVIESHMAEQGWIFSDGMLDDFIEFNSGSVVRIALARKKTLLLMPGQM